MTKERLYPFSKKGIADMEFAKDRLLNEYYDAMMTEDLECADSLLDSKQALAELIERGTARGNYKYALFTGPEIGFAKEVVAYAIGERDRLNHR